MSADNWALCPRCLASAEYAWAGIGPVDREQFRTFREDYEFYGSEDGTVHADYKGSCTVCSLTCELKAERTFWRPGDPHS